MKIYTHDHEPMHVHVWKAGNEVVISLEDLSVRELRGMGYKDVQTAQNLVSKHRDTLVSDWIRIDPLP